MSIEERTFMLRGVRYNKEFAFLNDQELRFKKKNFSIKKGFTELKIEQTFGTYPGKFVVFTTSKALQKLKENSTINIIENDKGIYVIESQDYRFINFNQVANVSRVEQVKDKYNIGSKEESQLELMETFIQFLLDLKVSYRTLSTKWLTGIQREIFYKDLSKEDLNFKDKRFNLMRASEEGKRKFVYQYLKKSCEDSGILETTEGEFTDVISIDVSSLYPYILIAFPFMIEDPYQYFYYNKSYGGKWDYLPIKFRRHIIEFYRKKEEGTTGKFYKLCLNSLTGKSISDYETGKDNQNKNNFLAPQHGFQVIEIGRRILNDMTEKLKKLPSGFEVLERDTDSVKGIGNQEEIKKLLEKENREIVERLIRSGLSVKDAQCGIGQWKFEYQAEHFIQRSAKHYSYCVNGEWTHKGERDETFTIGVPSAEGGI